MLELMREILEPHVHVHAHVHVRLQSGVAAGLLQLHWSWFHYYLWRKMLLHVRVLVHHVP
jgi:hypothetical protein